MKRVIALALLILMCLSFASCGDNGSCEYKESRDISDRDIKYVEIYFENYGKCVVLLDATTAPVTVANFISLVESGFYDGLTMHRVIKDFVIQISKYNVQAVLPWNKMAGWVCIAHHIYKSQNL